MFQEVEEESGHDSLLRVAALKIVTWWRILFPRRYALNIKLMVVQRRVMSDVTYFLHLLTHFPYIFTLFQHFQHFPLFPHTVCTYSPHISHMLALLARCSFVLPAGLLLGSRRLLRRLSARSCSQEILYDLVDFVVVWHHNRERRRYRTLRQAYAYKIQRFYRAYRRAILEEQYRIDLTQRKKVAERYLRVWCVVVLACLRICRWVKKVQRRIHMRQLRRGKAQGVASFNNNNGITVTPKSTSMSRVLGVVMRMYGLHINELMRRSTAQNAILNLVVGNVGHAQRRVQLRAQNKAAVKIQSAVRRKFAQQRMQQLRVMRLHSRTMQSIVIKWIFYFRRRSRQRHYNAAVRIQKRIRGSMTRIRMYKEIWARSVLLAGWRR